MRLYHSPHSQRKRENALVEALISSIPIEQVMHKNYPLSEQDGCITIPDILNKFEQWQEEGKRWPLLQSLLMELPDVVRVFMSSNQISCDVVIEHEGKPHFIEFHEQQHRTLSDKRMRKIYTLSGETILVPRYVQRFLRDMWRVQNLRPFTVIWYDWFALHGISSVDLLHDNYREYSVLGRFSFANLISL